MALATDGATASDTQRRLVDEIRRLREERNAVILAHNYQIGPIQDLADFVGDSLGLAQAATRTDAPLIVMCGVYFMAETAKILNPRRTVLIPETRAGCSLADSITADQLRAWKAEHPGAVVVSYVNTTAEVKAETDICVTSGNAEAVIRSIPPDREILFCPDMFLGAYLERVTGRKMHVWLGECHVHAGIRPEEIDEQRGKFPGSELLIHPECGCSTRYLWAQSAGAMQTTDTHVLSTEGMLRRARQSDRTTFLIATETGLLHRLRKEMPEKRFEPADDGAVCRYMKMITLPNLRDCLRDLAPEVEVPTEILERARHSVERMLAIKP
ncbi:MAG: quinolinate synthase NadA [Chloroflexota bacterium]